eukprot:3068574-Amphidinium_carterae.1
MCAGTIHERSQPFPVAILVLKQKASVETLACVPAAGSAGELLDHLQTRGLRAAFLIGVSARVRSIKGLQSAIRDGNPV